MYSTRHGAHSGCWLTTVPYRGRKYSPGDQAMELGLVDQLGNFYDALEVLKKDAKITAEPTLVYPLDERGRLLDQLMGGAARSLVGAVREGIAQEALEARSPGLYFLPR
jgi:protease-4